MVLHAQRHVPLGRLASKARCPLTLTPALRPRRRLTEGLSATGTTKESAPRLRQLPTSMDGLGLKSSGLGDEGLLRVLKSAQVIASTSSVSLMADRLLASILSSLKRECGFVLLCEANRLRCEAARPERDGVPDLSGSRAAAVYAALDSRAPVLAPCCGEDLEGTLCLPLVAEGRVVGVVGVTGRFEGDSAIPGLEMATALCGLCAGHVANAGERAHLRREFVSGGKAWKVRDRRRGDHFSRRDRGLLRGYPSETAPRPR